MITGPSGAIDAGDGVPESHASPALGDRAGYDEFDLEYRGYVGGSESSFSVDDLPG